MLKNLPWLESLLRRILSRCASPRVRLDECLRSVFVGGYDHFVRVTVEHALERLAQTFPARIPQAAVEEAKRQLNKDGLNLSERVFVAGLFARTGGGRASDYFLLLHTFAAYRAEAAHYILSEPAAFDEKILRRLWRFKLPVNAEGRTEECTLVVGGETPFSELVCARLAEYLPFRVRCGRQSREESLNMLSVTLSEDDSCFH